ncbi:MAG: hypothetical protein ACO31I_04250 [Prochlorotrichaceae cyanobacterium]|jgi:hypothetical protein
MLKLFQRLGLSVLISGLYSFPLGLQAQPLSKGVAGVSGLYSETLQVGIDSTHNRITGYYTNSSGWDETLAAPRFVCQFYFSGEWQNDRYHITSWHPDSDHFIAGEVHFQEEDGTPTATLQLQEEHGGCWNVQHFADPGGVTVQLTQPTSWQALRLVSAHTAFIHTTPAGDTRTDLALPAGSVVGVLARDAGWTEVDLSESTESVPMSQGWLKTLALLPEHPPTATLEGTVIFPSDTLPAQRICAEAIATDSQAAPTSQASQTPIICTETAEGEEEFTLAVPPGTYEVFAQRCQQSYEDRQFCSDGYVDERAYYNEYVACGITYECSLKISQQTNLPIPIQVESGQTIPNISPHDWYTLN